MSNQFLRRAGAFALAFVGVLASASLAAAAVVPTVVGDDNTINSNCTLREAIRSINEKKKIDACNWVAGETAVYLGGVTYTISSALGTIPITATSINILGAGHRVTAINMQGAAKELFTITPTAAGGAAFINDLTLRNSTTTGIRLGTNAQVSLNKVKISQMGSTFSSGACIAVDAGTLYLDNSEIADCRGTGLKIAAGGVATVQQSTITRSYGERGGAIQNGGTLYLDRSTLGNNEATAYGGAILNLGTATVYGSTIAYNKSGTSNIASGAIHNSVGGTITIEGSIIANNSAPVSTQQANCYLASPSWPVTSRGYNVIGEAAGYTCGTGVATDVVGNPKLRRASGNSPGAAGGVGSVYVPEASSVAVRKIPVAHSVCRARDQRGVIRTRRNQCDIGAVNRIDALMVVGVPQPPGDYMVSGHLFGMGADISTVADTAVTAESTIGMALVVISESVTSGNVNSKLRNVAVPILNLEPLLADDLRMTGPTQGTDYDLQSGNRVTMVGDRGTALGVPHRFGVVDGTVTVTSSDQSMGWTKVPSGTSPAISAVFHTATARKMLMTYWTGYTMYGGFTAPALRVSFFATVAACSALTLDGQALLLEVMVWAAGA